MASVVGQASAAATSVAIPAHQVGDLIIVSARGTAAPTVPAAAGTVPAWVTLQSATANSIGLTTVAFVATATNTTTGTFTGATHICVLVLRPASLKKLQTAAARSSTGNGNNTQTIIYPALTLNNGGGASTSVGVRIGTRVTADSEVGTNIPSGWTNQSIQPAGASALMAVHTRLALAANPTADSIATAGTNAAYRAHTVEVEEVPLGSTITFDCVIAESAAVAVDATVIPPPVTLDAVITTNQPYAGVYDCGEFTCGVGSVMAVDLQIVSIDLLDGLIAGQAQVSAALDRSRDLLPSGVVGVGAVTAALSVTRGVAASIDRTSAVTAQQGVTRAVAASIVGAGVVVADTFVGHTITFGCTVAGQAAVAPALAKVYALASTVAGVGAISADIIRVPVTVSLGCDVAGAAAIAPSLTVTNASFVSLDAAVSGQGSLSVQVASQRSLAAAISGVGSLAVQQAPLRGIDASISRQGAVTAQADATRALAATVSRAASIVAQQDPILATGGPVYFDATISRAAAVAVTTGATRSLAVTVSRFGAVSVDITRVGAVIDFACSLGLPLAGQKLCGTFLVGSGPGATVEAQMGPVVVSFVATINRTATVTAAALWERTFAPSLITGQSAVSAQMLITRGLEASINRTASVVIDGRVIRLVQFECEIKVIPHICNQYLSGQQVCGGTGPRASIAVQNVTSGPFAISIQGNASIESLLRPSTSFASAITGKAEITTESRPSLPFSAVVGGQANVVAYHTTKLVLGTGIVGKAALKAKLNLDWLVPTEPAGIILVPTDEEDLILVPTTNGSVTLVPTSPGSVTLVPTDEEDLLLVPTTERTM